MIKTIHVAQYEGALDEAINAKIAENNIFRDKLISIEYSTKFQKAVRGGGGGNGYYPPVEMWFASALIIYDE